jgi:hypothetical protein
MLETYIYVRGKGTVPYDPSQLSFVDEVKLTNSEGWKLNLQYENTKSWSVPLPKFDTNQVSVKDGRYFLRTKYNRVLDRVNQLAAPIAKHIYQNREKLGVTISEKEIETMLMKDLFVARTLHPNVFVDGETGKQMDLSTLKSRFKVKCYVRPVVYIRDNNHLYIDLETVRACLFKQVFVKREKVYQVKNVVVTAI